MNQVISQTKKHRSLVPVLSVAMALSLALSYFTFFSSSSFQIEKAGNTASVILAQGTGGATQGGGTGGATQRPPTGQSGFANPLGQSGGTLQTFLYALLDKVVIPLGAIVVIFSIILAGYKYITAQGDPKAISAAHQQLTWTAIGAAVLLGAKVISMVITNTVKTLTS
ncbi:MAG: hypothetical protein RIQ72_375 [Candidatus Parcubacteria bacterium]|jgi:hypothetical protein